VDLKQEVPDLRSGGTPPRSQFNRCRDDQTEALQVALLRSETPPNVRGRDSLILYRVRSWPPIQLSERIRRLRGAAARRPPGDYSWTRARDHMELDLPADLWLPGRPPQIDDEVPAAALIPAMSVHGRRYCRRCDGAARDRRCKHRVKTVEAGEGGSRQGTHLL